MGSSDLSQAAQRLRDLVDVLPVEQKNLFSSCAAKDQLADQIHVLEDGHTGRRSFILRVRRFASALEPFFKAIDVVSQVDPLHFAIVWGSLRILVELLNRFTDFFEKLTESLDRLVKDFDYFQRVNEHVSNLEAHGGIKAILEDTFTELLNYLVGVLGIFHKTNGQARGRTRIVLRTAWRPFRFEATAAKLKDLQQNLEREISLQSLKNSQQISRTACVADTTYVSDHITRLQQEFQHESDLTFRHRLRYWLSASSFADRYDLSKRRRLRGTSEWVFRNDQFLSWQRKEQATMEEGSGCSAVASSLWIYGKPGSGKTILSGSIIERLKAKHPDAIICYYHFNSLESSFNSSCDAFRAILAQIVQQSSDNQRLKDLFAFAMFFNSDGQTTASSSEIDELFNISVSLLFDQKLYLVLDGVDECFDLASGLVPTLTKVCEHSPISLILLSRETVTSTVRRIPNLQTVGISLNNQPDIQLFLSEELKALVSSRHLPENFRVKDSAAKLVRRADGMFLWAALMMSYVRLPGLLQPDRVRALSDLALPEGLEVMYERIIRYISNQASVSVTLACFVLRWLVFTKTDLYLRQLVDAIVSDKGRGLTRDGLDLDQSLKELFEVILNVCGGFVEYLPLQPQDSLGTYHVRLVHASVREYLLAGLPYGFLQKPKLQDLAILSSKTQGNLALASFCLEYLVYSIPAQPISTKPDLDAREMFRTTFPFGEYAIAYWADHLLALSASSEVRNPKNKRLTEDLKKLLSRLNSFLSQPKAITAWIEACYIFRLSLSFRTLRAWAENTSRGSWSERLTDIKGIVTTAKDLSIYLEDLDSSWGPQLCKDPSCVWVEVGAFSPSPFIAKAPGIDVSRLVSEAPKRSLTHSEPITKISQLLVGGSLDMVLSVYPSKAFFTCYRRTSQHHELLQNKKYSLDWITRVELFKVGTSELITFLEHKLDDSEVSLQLHQTYLEGAIQFPLSISSTGRYFTVLRTLFTLSVRGSEIHLNHVRLPLDQDPSTRDFWTIMDDYEGYFRRVLGRMERPELKGFVAYLYWIYFDDAGQHICIAEQVKYKPMNFRVLRMPKVTSTTKPSDFVIVAESSKWMRRLEQSYCLWNKKDFRLVFHPCLPVLALAGTAGIYLWNFAAEVNNRLIRVHNGCYEMDYFAFSADGNSLVMNAAVSPYPQVFNVSTLITVPAGTYDVESTSQTSGLSGHLGLTSSSHLESHSNELNPFSSLTGAPRQVISAGANLVKMGSESFETTVSIQQGTATMAVKKSNLEATLRLARLPNWRGSAAAEASVVLPSEPDKPLQIVLDKTAETWNRIENTFDGKQEAAFPLVIHRDLDSFQQSEISGVVDLLSASDQVSTNLEEASGSAADRDLVDRDLDRKLATKESVGASSRISKFFQKVRRRP